MVYNGTTYDTFICYRGESTISVAAVLSSQIKQLSIEGKCSYTPFFAPESIPKGYDFKSAVNEVMTDIKYFIMILSEGFFDRCNEPDDIVMHEIKTALSFRNIDFIPIIVGDYNIAKDEAISTLFSKEQIDRFKHISAIQYAGIYNFKVESDLIPVLDALKSRYESKTIPFSVDNFQYDGEHCVYLGKYPQHIVSDTRVTDNLMNALLQGTAKLDQNKWINYDGDLYSTLSDRPFNKTKFTDGNDVTNGTTHYYKVEPISWRIIFRDNHYLVLLSDMIIDAVRFNRDREYHFENGKYIPPNNWEHSDIRNWLNGAFYHSVFNDLEKKRIVPVRLDNSKDSSYYETEEQNSTIDKVFLMSHKEIYRTKCGFALVTDFAKARGAYASTSSSHNNHGDWWTRSPGNVPTSIENVDRRGCIIDDMPFCNYVDDTAASVRPAVMVRI